jgi:NAD(P)H-dependent FMN reductase
MKNILFLVGSLRKESLNKRLSFIAERLLSEKYVATRYDLADIPLFNGDFERNAPDSVLGLREAVGAADGVFWTTPEYNYALPGVVKNAIDWASRPMLPRNSIVGTPMNGVVATGPATNGIRSLTDLKRIWNGCGGAAVGFDFVLQQAHTKFVDQDGEENLEPVALKMLKFNIDNLQRSIDDNGKAVATANWDAYVEQMT